MLILGTLTLTQTDLGFTMLEDVQDLVLVLLIVICCLLYWCCKRTQSQETRLLACATNAAPENLNMLHTRVDAIGTDKCSVPG